MGNLVVSKEANGVDQVDDNVSFRVERKGFVEYFNIVGERLGVGKEVEKQVIIELKIVLS